MEASVVKAFTGREYHGDFSRESLRKFVLGQNRGRGPLTNDEKETMDRLDSLLRLNDVATTNIHGIISGGLDTFTTMMERYRSALIGHEAFMANIIPAMEDLKEHYTQLESKLEQMRECSRACPMCLDAIENWNDVHVSTCGHVVCGPCRDKLRMHGYGYQDLGQYTCQVCRQIAIKFNIFTG